MSNQKKWMLSINKGQGILKTVFQKFGIYVIFLGIIIFFSFQSKAFLTPKNAVNILQAAAPLGIATVGIFFVLISGGIDISIASNMYLSAVLAGTLMEGGYVSLFVAFIIGILVGCVIGGLNGFFISKLKIVPFITTMATMGIAKGLGLAISKSHLILFGNNAVKFASAKVFGFFPVMALIFVAVCIIADLILRRTPYGLQIYAIGNNATGSVKMGINVTRQVFIAYVVCGMLSGFAGMISACQLTAVQSNFASGDEFVVISAAVVGGASLFGGKGRVFPGAIIGVVMVTIIINGLNIMNASPYAYNIVRGLIIFIAVMMDSINNKGEIR